jgi:hypothetical protein
LFHDTAESVTVCSQFDPETLRANGYQAEVALTLDTFVRALVRRADQTTKLEWSFDSAFRFFPVEPDPELGYRLSLHDAATNKMLAMVGRAELRDYVDVLHLDRTCLSVGALCWAAAGKDPGLTPDLILGEAGRHTHYRPEDLARLQFATPVSLESLKQHWLQAARSTESLRRRLPAQDVGCLYLDAQNRVVESDPDSPDFGRLRRHFGSVKGAWPVVR